MITHNPLHGSGQADFPHPALALGDDAHAAQGIGMTDSRHRQPAVDEAPHATSTALAFSGAAQGGMFSATVNTNSGGAPPSGTVTFFIGGTQVGSPVPVTGIPAVINPQTGAIQGAQATATFADTGLANGAYTISATYSGDSNYGGSSAPPIAITVQPDYSLTASANSITITSPGGTGSSTLTINAIDGFNAAVNFSCSNLPAMSSCQFSPASVSGSGSTTLTITTTAPVALLVPGDRPNGVDWWTSSGEVTLVSILLFVGVSWRRRWGKLPSLATFALLLVALGCGGGSSSPSPPPPNPGTSPGTYTVTITATSGSIVHNISLTLNVL
jgi:trimeric autotransporter adhesin